MIKVVILQHRLLHYRVSFFEQLRQLCATRGIELHLVHGQASRREKAKKDEGSISWSHKVNNSFWEVGSADVIWQPFPKSLRDADLIVLIQENRIISQYLFILSRYWSKRKIAYWGHGANLQSKAPRGLRERWKQLLLTKVDWWFAYTSATTDILVKAGFPFEKITCLNNAIDNGKFKSELEAISASDLDKAKSELGIINGAPIGLFCGSLYPDKRLDILIEASDIIQANHPEYHLVVLGDGPSMPIMQDAEKSRSWLHILGIKKGAEKALYFRMADFLLNPGAVGLHIVDAFCAGLIMLTTENAKHGPEIAYLQNGVNGLATRDSAEEYANAVLGLLRDRT